MREAWAGLLEKADLAVAACAGVVEEGLLESSTGTIREARLRLAYPEEVTVVALVGGTGSGKSSLLNAMMGAEIAETGSIRPTTSAPVAVTPRAAGESLDGYLGHLGVAKVHHEGPLHWLCLIDMPDTDSIEVGHRLEVERLLPVLDAVAWVIDPEKYRDANLHREHIAPLAAHDSQFVFVLNQADRLDGTATRAVTADLLRALGEDGISDPALVVTAADPPAGPPRGIDDLLDALAERAGTPESVYRKIQGDLAEMAESLLAATGGSGLDFETRALAAVEQATLAISNGEETEAVLGLTTFLDEIASEAGDALAGQIEAMAIRVPIEVRRAAEGEGPPLGDSVLAPVRSLLRRRARANAALADLALALQSMDAGTAR
jgi:GTP-binding protein EngB required for normal cell division